MTSKFGGSCHHGVPRLFREEIIEFLLLNDRRKKTRGLHVLTNACGPGCQEVKIATCQSSRMGQGVGRQGMGL